jgi:NAD-dependent deacetylase
MAEVLQRVDAGDPDPRCLDCGGIQKSATISFGQALESDVLAAAVAAATSCDVFLAVGTSLQVHPVAGLCGVATKAGARLVIVNGEPTPYDEEASAVVREPIGSALPRLAAYVAAG